MRGLWVTDLYSIRSVLPYSTQPHPIQGQGRTRDSRDVGVLERWPTKIEGLEGERVSQASRGIGKAKGIPLRLLPGTDRGEACSSFIHTELHTEARVLEPCMHPVGTVCRKVQGGSCTETCGGESRTSRVPSIEHSHRQPCQTARPCHACQTPTPCETELPRQTCSGARLSAAPVTVAP